MNSEIILQVGVKVLLKNLKGEYLFVRRNPKKYPEVGAVWDIVGGRINAGTTLIENLKREVKEETGLDLVKPVRLVGAQDILKVPGRHIVRLTYLGEISGEPVMDEENTEHVWMTKEQIKNLPVGTLDSFFNQLLETEKFLE